MAGGRVSFTAQELRLLELSDRTDELCEIHAVRAPKRRHVDGLGRLTNDDARAMHLSGARRIDIAVAAGVGTDAVGHWRRAHGLARRYGTVPAGENYVHVVSHCPHGHPYAGDNVRHVRDGRRMCRTCDRERQRAKRGRA